MSYEERAFLLAVCVFLLLLSSAPGATTSYLDNGNVKVGVNLSLGGAITYLSPSSTDYNVVNSYDWGREIQQSYYSGPSPYVPDGATQNPAWAGFPWNPVQAGDSYGNRSQLLAWSNDGSQLYIKSRPMQWALQNVPADCTVEEWITLDGAVATVRNRLTMLRSDTTQYPAYGQELPAVYTISSLTKLMTYNGTQPFANGVLTQIPNNPNNPDGFPWSSWRATENWAAYVNSSNWGLGVYLPGACLFGGGLVGSTGGGSSSVSTGYIAPVRREILDHNIVYDYNYQLILGSLSDIRGYVYSHRTELRPDCRFNGSRQHWTYQNASDSGAPVGDHLHVQWDTNSDPQMVGPECAFQAADVPKLYIRAAFNLSANDNAQLFWETNNGANPFSEAQSYVFPVINDGKYHTYVLDLSSNPYWKGEISCLRFDPAGYWSGSMDIASISYVPEPSTLALLASAGAVSIWFMFRSRSNPLRRLKSSGRSVIKLG